MRDSANTSGPIYMWPAIICTGLASVNCHPHPHGHISRPCLAAQAALYLAGCGNCITGAGKNRKDAIAFAPLQNERAIVSVNSRSHNFVVAPQRELCLQGKLFPRPG